MIKKSDHLLLVGMMGSGKSSVGAHLSRRLGRPFFDSDVEVEERTGSTVREIFERDGEAAFRRLEKEALRSACESPSPAVIAVAGGAVLEPENRNVIANAGRVIWLRAKTQTLVRRLGDGSGRPLLAGDVSEAVKRLDKERRPLYEELADVIVDVDDLSASAVSDELVERLRERVVVDLDDRSYEVVVGPGARDCLASLFPSAAKRAAIVTQQAIGVEVACPISSMTFLIEDGEKAKSLSSVEDLCSGFARFGLTRADVIVAVGGGVVTDVAGFAAASYHRGTAVIHVPTTLLGQIDAAIGGKTGVNLPEGKNLVGAFFQPVGVICDTDVLSTLPEREWCSGLGEMAKYAFLGVEDLDELSLAEQVARCVSLKADVVSSDERETGHRAVLNYGHTLAHALEAVGLRDGIDLRHGEAVGIGLVFAARLAELLGRIDADRMERHVDVVKGFGLATGIPIDFDRDSLLAFMARDKKATTGLTFVLDGPRGVEPVNDVVPDLVMQALALSAAWTTPIRRHPVRRGGS